MMIGDIGINSLLLLISRMKWMTMILISNNNGNKLNGHENWGKGCGGWQDETRESSDNQSAQIISSHGEERRIRKSWVTRSANSTHPQRKDVFYLLFASYSGCATPFLWLPYLSKFTLSSIRHVGRMIDSVKSLILSSTLRSENDWLCESLL